MTGGPLVGVRVVELAGLGPPVHVGMIMADLGAEVLRIERPGAADSGVLTHLLRGRTRCTIDIKSAEGPAAVLAQVAVADILVEGFRPGVTERLGIGPVDCARVNPGLIYVRVTGWGQDGPRASQAGHDINYIGLTGVLHAIGRAGGRPVPPLNIVGDFGGGSMLAVIGALAALHERAGTGRGQVVDAAIVDGVSLLAQMQFQYLQEGRWSLLRGANRLDGGAPYYDTYRCSDGRYVAVGALEDTFWGRLLDGLGIEPTRWPDRADPARWPEIRRVLTELFAQRPRDDWDEIFASLDACVTPVLSFTESAADRHLKARGTLTPTASGFEAAAAPRIGPLGSPQNDRIR
ncbi:alpha-methylacyl-CoA racemase [Amycolatopsis ultiminotia]|uniref:Alpha-methylacyl-CoA racemase n=1 Tax=Amycolatopsis ultiminotia TaxID=543629 RepID=A0ABP6XIM6_9PSEU